MKESIASRLKGLFEPLRFNRTEAGGALGDLGTFIPLLVAMVNKCGLQLGPALFGAGLMNIVTGLAFGIPMAVQPMKAIAAVAITEGLSESQILAAGIITALIILLLSVTGLVDWLNGAIPRSVVRGLQVALGVKLLVKGFGMIALTGVFFGWDSIGFGLICVGIILLLRYVKHVPSALVVFGLGLIALLASQPQVLQQTTLGMNWHMPELLSANAWMTGLWRGAIPQIPLTMLNSIVAVCALSGDLFPKRPASPRNVGLSVAMMNLICCPFGAMPMCHGAGGLAAQYRFGARTGGSVIMLGVAKMVLAVSFGGSLLLWLQHYPQSALGALLLFSGIELALMGRDQKKTSDRFVMALTAAICFFANTALGFLIGWPVGVLLAMGLKHYSNNESKNLKTDA